MAKKEIKVVLTKAGTSYDNEKAYKLHDYILIDKVTMYICKRVDPTTMTCVGHDLSDTAYWDKCIDMHDTLDSVNEATAKAITTYQHPPYVDADGYYYRWNVETNSYDKTDVNLTGKSFKIEKVFPSVSAMNAVDASTFAENDFILINTANVEDEDNAKLYVVATNEQGKKFYSYLVDMSGFRGFTGKTPQISIGTVTTIGSGEQASAALSADGTDSDGNPKYKLNLSIPKGDKLVFADLTSEEIKLLQKPATDAAATANAAAEKASTATTYAEKVNATITDDVLVITDRNGTQKNLSLVSQAKANELSTDVARIKQSMGAYSERPSISLTAVETNKAVSTDGVKVTKNGWAIAEFTAEKGNEYLFKPGTIDGSVCIFAEKIDKVETRSIDYTYTYDGEGNVLTAMATYLGATHTYTFTRSTSDDGVITETITDEKGNVVNALPYQYTTQVGAYSPLVRLNANAELPTDGYCRFVSHFQGNNAIKVAVSYKVVSADTTMVVLRDGMVASLSTQLGNLSQKENETRQLLSNMDEDHKKRLANLEQAVGDLGGSVDSYYYASQDTSKASPDLVNPQTNASIQMLQDMYRPFLIDHSDNDREQMIGYELKRNNWLRYKENSFAPAVGITEEQRAACDVELYLDAEHTQKYCDAGAFNAERFYNEYGLAQKLYDGEGNEISHILRPWETTSKNYSVKVGDPSVNWLIDDYSTKDGEGNIMYRGILKSYREVAGIKPRKLAPTLISPCDDTSIKDTDGKVKFRSFFFLYNAGGDSNTVGSIGDYGGSMFKEDGRCYPRVNDVNQVSSMTYARNNNKDANKTYPFAEAGFHAYNTFVSAHELLYGTNYLNDPDNLFSPGTCANNPCGNEAQWKKYGGVRIKVGDDGDWKYLNWNTTPNWIYKDANKTTINAHMSAWLNREFPKWQENEAQIALSFASEMGIAEDTEFEVYGNKYWYVTPPKAKGINDGYMNARVYRKYEDDWQGYDANGNAVTYHIEAIARQGIIDGVTTAGDVFHYRGGGFEQVSEVLVTQDVNRYDYPTDLYIETDQKNWHTEKTVYKNDKGVFDFEKSYEKVAHIDATKTGWMMRRYGNTPHCKAVGGNSSTYVTALDDNTNYFSNTVGQRVRRSVRCGGLAIWATCASRYMYATIPCSDASRSNGGSAQCLFEAASQGAARPKALQAQ